MKLFIESIFDKDVKSIDEAKVAAVKAANVLEKQHGNTAAGKIFYFSTVLDKLVVATGDFGKKAMMLKENVLLVKPIPEIKMGDIPTKMARYQELIIPTLDLKEERAVFTKITDLNDEKSKKELEAVFSLKEVANENEVRYVKGHDISTSNNGGYAVEMLDKQPKFLQIKASDYANAEISFEYVDEIDNGGHGSSCILKINGEEANVGISNNTIFEIKHEVLKTSKGLQLASVQLVKVTLSGYFPVETNISIESSDKSSHRTIAFVPGSLQLEDIKPFEVPVPYTNVAKRVDGVAHHNVIINSTVTDGITFGAVLNYKKYSDPVVYLKVFNNNNNYILIRKKIGDTTLEVAYASSYKSGVLPLSISIPRVHESSYFQMSINFKSENIIVIAGGITRTIELPETLKGANLTNFEFGGDNISFLTNMWYHNGDTVDIEAGTEKVSN